MEPSASPSSRTFHHILSVHVVCANTCLGCGNMTRSQLNTVSTHLTNRIHINSHISHDKAAEGSSSLVGKIITVVIYDYKWLLGS